MAIRSLLLEDTSPMPFGKYAGLLMQDVSASYFHYLWFNGMKQDKTNPVHIYIKLVLMN